MLSVKKTFSIYICVNKEVFIIVNINLLSSFVRKTLRIKYHKNSRMKCKFDSIIKVNKKSVKTNDEWEYINTFSGIILSVEIVSYKYFICL